MAEAAVLQDSSMLANHFLTRDGRIRTGDPLNPIHNSGVLVGSAKLGSVP